jgi:DNA invertase Pin-like site-specific DNA recombinase
MPNILAYYRVSTLRQGKSGLGLEAQRAAVERFAEGEGLTIVKEFIEIESGKGADALNLRPKLAIRRIGQQEHARITRRHGVASSFRA